MHATIEPSIGPRGFAPEPMSSRVFVRSYERYGDAKRARDQLSVVARIPDKRMTVVARGLEWREDLPTGALYKVACGLATVAGAVVGLVLWAIGLTAAQTGWFAQTIVAGVIGAVFGFVVASVVARLRQNRAGMVETGHVEPRQYDILVEEDLVGVARATLEGR